MPDIVNGILLRGGEALLARRSKHRARYADVWSFPGGHVDVGETFEQALIRELAEEIGVTPLTYRLFDYIVVLGAEGERTEFHLFVVSHWAGEPEILDAEHTELRWVPLLQAAQLEDLALDASPSLFRALHIACRAR